MWPTFNKRLTRSCKLSLKIRNKSNRWHGTYLTKAKFTPKELIPNCTELRKCNVLAKYFSRELTMNSRKSNSSKRKSKKRLKRRELTTSEILAKTILKIKEQRKDSASWISSRITGRKTTQRAMMMTMTSMMIFNMIPKEELLGQIKLMLIGRLRQSPGISTSTWMLLQT